MEIIMKPRLLLATSVLVLLLAGNSSDTGVAQAADAGEAARPVLVLQVKAAKELLASLKTAAKNFLPEPVFEDFERDVLSKLDLNRIKGVDPKRPIALYATLGAGVLKGDLSKTSLVAVVPVSDERAFMDLLGNMNMPPMKQGDEHVIPIPNTPILASLRFRQGYAYISVAPGKTDGPALLDLQHIFRARQTAAAALTVRLDQIPSDLRKEYLVRFEQNLEQKAAVLEAERGPPDGPSTPDRLRVDTALRTMRWIARWLKLLINDGEELTFEVDLDPTTAVMGAELSLQPRPGSDLARSTAELRPTTNDFAGIVTADSAAHVLMAAPLYVRDLKDMLVNLARSIEQNPAGARNQNSDKATAEVVAAAAKAVARTLDEGKLHLAVSLRGPDQNNQFVALAAFTLKDAAALEKALKNALKSAPEDVAKRIKLGVFQVNGVKVHEIGVGSLLPPDVQKIFGQASIYLGIATDAVFVTFGPRAKEAITEVLAGRSLLPRPAPLVQAELSGKRVMALFKTLGAPREALQFIEKLTSAERSTVLAIKVRRCRVAVARRVRPASALGRGSQAASVNCGDSRYHALLPMPIGTYFANRKNASTGKRGRA
jgi:hypothetical protein